MMKAVLLNGMINDNDTLMLAESMILEKLNGSGWETSSITIRDKKVAYCIGCFGCWLKTPGICVINDDGRDIGREVIQSDLAILLTPVTFGGYSSELKKAMDRLIPNILPFFKKVNGEIHHSPRYDKYPNILVIGFMDNYDSDQVNLFKKLVDRNAINFYCREHGAGILLANTDTANIEAEMNRLLKVVGVVS